MEKDFQLGPEALAKLSFGNGKARIELDYTGKQATAGSYVELSIDAFLLLLEGAIANPAAKAGIEILKSALDAVA